jgi:uncharacterized protein YgbK (DUF1537 family)
MSEPPTPAPRPEVVILADDLTGTCDTAQPFAAVSPTGVLTRDLRGLEHSGGWRVLGINGRTRSLEPQAARAATREILRRLGDLGPALLYKKIDSTLRGNVAAELQAVAEAFPDRAVLVAPAFPAMGRTTLEGQVLVRGVPADRTEYAADPRHPVRDASLLRLCGGEGRPGPELVPLAQVREGAAALAAALARARGPARFLCVDAETDADLEAIARATEACGIRYVLVGSAGLAGALARARRGQAAADASPAWPAAWRRLAVIGTRNPAAVSQVECVRREGLAALIAVHPEHCQGPRRGLEVCLLRVRARAALSAGQDAVVHVAGGFAPEVSASRLLAAVVDGIAPDAVRGLILSGGGTAEAVLERLGAWGIQALGGAIPPGCSLGLLRGGRYEGIRVLLKAGGFGGGRFLGELLNLPASPPGRPGGG